MSDFETPHVEAMAFPHGRARDLKRLMVGETRPAMCAVLAARWEAARLTEEAIENLKTSRRLPVRQHHIIQPEQVSEEKMREAIRDAVTPNDPRIAGLDDWDEARLLAFDVRGGTAEISPSSAVEVPPDDHSELLEKERQERESLAGHTPPDEIADLIILSDTAEQTNEKLIAKYAREKNMAELAIKNGDDAERLRWERAAQRTDSAIRWNRGRMVETM